jgi:hypothetical protein
MNPILLILVILLILSVFGGGWGYRTYGYGAWSPAFILLVVLLLLLLLGAIPGGRVGSVPTVGVLWA